MFLVSLRLFLKVIIPLAEKKASNSNNLFAKFNEPVKQCIKILSLF